VAIATDSTNVLCNVANQQQSPITTGLCLLCTVTDPNNAIDGDPNTASNIRGNVSLLASVGQLVKFQQTGKAGDSIRLIMGTKAGLLDAGILNGIQVQYYLKGSPVTSTPLSLNDALLHLRLLQGANKSTIIIAAPNDYDGIKVSIGGVATLVTSVYLYHAEQLIPLPAVSSADTVTICPGSKATLEASLPAGSTDDIVWYDAPTGGTQLHVGSTYTTPALSKTTTYYLTSRRGDCPNPNREHITVKVNRKADSVDIVAKSDTICTGDQVTLQASSTTVADPIFTWYSDVQLTNKLATGTDYTVSPAATTIYYVTVQGKGICENAPDSAREVKVTVNPRATEADITAKSDTICKGEQVTLTANTTAITQGIFTWYSDAKLTNKLFTGSDFTVNPEVTTTYYVTVQGTGLCENAPEHAAAVKVTVNPRADSTDITVTGATICIGDEATLHAGSSTITNPVFSWYSDAKLTNRLFVGSDYKVNPTATTTYYVAVQGEGICINAPDSAKKVTVVVNPLPDKPQVNTPGSPICGSGTATLDITNVQTGVTYNWYTSDKGGSPVHTGTSFTTPSLTATTTYYVEAANAGGCINTGGRATVTVTVDPVPDKPQVNVPAEPICGSGTATLDITNAQTGVTYNWYTSDKGGSPVHTGTSFTTPSLTATTIYYIEAANTGGCINPEGRTAVTVTVNPIPDKPQISAPAGPVCSGSTVTLEITNASSSVNYKWYTSDQGGSQINIGSSYTTPELTTTTTYYVEAVNMSGCTSGERTSVTVTVTPAPDKPQVSAPAGSVCGGGSVTLDITNVQTGVVYNWYTSDKGGTPVFTGTTYTTSLQTTTTYYVEAVNAGGCTNTGGRTVVKVTVDPVPLPPTVEATDVTVCTGNSATFKIKNPDADLTYNWYDIAKGGAPVETGENFTTPALQTNAVYYVEAVSKGGCVSASRTQVSATVVGPPAAPTVKISANPVCPGTSAVLTASSATPGVTFRWYDSKTGGSPISTDNPFTTPALNAGTTYYVEAVNAGGCTNTGGRTEAAITVLMKLPAPQVKVIDSTGNSITFGWDIITGAIGYQISMDNGATWQQPSSGATGTEHQITGLQPNKPVTIMVRALGQSDCQNSDAARLTANTSNPLGNKIFVPNAFSPNGDGLNDTWHIYGNSISKLVVTVWNQYGQKIFESRSQQNDWDGTYKGKVQPIGVYVYHLEVTFQDGTSLTKDGDINIVR
jgi:gliding motility-associated-like protein